MTSRCEPLGRWSNRPNLRFSHQTLDCVGRCSWSTPLRGPTRHRGTKSRSWKLDSSLTQSSFPTRDTDMNPPMSMASACVPDRKFLTSTSRTATHSCTTALSSSAAGLGPDDIPPRCPEAFSRQSNLCSNKSLGCELPSIVSRAAFR
jgi:hypothetical protein